jgi:hypothetical protein
MHINVTFDSLYLAAMNKNCEGYEKYYNNVVLSKGKKEKLN